MASESRQLSQALRRGAADYNPEVDEDQPRERGGGLTIKQVGLAAAVCVLARAFFYAGNNTHPRCRQFRWGSSRCVNNPSPSYGSVFAVSAMVSVTLALLIFCARRRH